MRIDPRFVTDSVPTDPLMPSPARPPAFTGWAGRVTGSRPPVHPEGR